MGIISAIIGWLQYHLGIRTDAASTTGSLHAKVKDLRNQCDVTTSSRQKPRVAQVPGSFGTDQTDWQTVLSISGKGKLNALSVKSSNTTVAHYNITVDGTIVFQGKGTGSFDNPGCPTGAFLTGNLSSTIGLSSSGDQGNLGGGISFANSLVINFRADTANYVSILWEYELEQ